MKVHLIGVAGADTGTFERHGYGEAMRVQIEHGIFDYCGAEVLSSTLLDDSEGADQAAHLHHALALGKKTVCRLPGRSLNCAQCRYSSSGTSVLYTRPLQEIRRPGYH